MAIPNLKDLQSLGEIKQNFRWNIDFANLSKKLKITNDPNFKKIAYACESVDLPKKSIEYNLVNIRGIIAKQPGYAITNGEITFTFIDNVDNIVEDMIYNWSNLISDTTKKSYDNTSNNNNSIYLSGKNSNEYKCDLPIYRLNAARKIITKYTLIGCSFMNYDPGASLSGGDSEMSRPTLTISYDTWYKE